MKLLLSLFFQLTSIVTFFVCVSIYVLATTLVHPYKTLALRCLLCRLIILANGQWLVIEGKSPDGNGPFLYLANHESLLDAFIFGAAMPARVTAVAAEDYFWIPVWGALMRRYGIIPIKRKVHDRAMESMAEAVKAVRQGTSLIMLPEGTRTPDGEVQEFKKGAFYLALEAEPTIVPLAIIGAYQARNRNSWLIRPGVIRLRFGQPIAPEQYHEDTPAGLAGWLRMEISALKVSKVNMAE